MTPPTAGTDIDPSSSIPDPTRYSKADSFLKVLELVTVSLITISIWIVFAWAVLWMVFGIGNVQQGRLATALKTLTIDWKVGLLLLIPLFYRTVREILERMEEGPLGTKFPKPKAPIAETADSEEETRPKPGEAK